MFGLLSTYDLTDYGSFRILGIVLSVVLAAAVLIFTIVSYLKTRRKEMALAPVAAGASVTPAVPEADPLAADAEKAAEPIAAEPADEAAGEPQPAEPAAEETAADDNAAAEPTAEEVEETAAITPTAPYIKKPESSAPDESASDEAKAAAGAPLPFWAKETAATNAEDIPDTPPAFFDDMLAEFTAEERESFFRVVIDNPDGLKLSIRRPLGLYADEKDFLRDFFLSISKLRGALPLASVEKLYLRNYEYMTNDYRRSRLNNKMIGVYYYRRAEDGVLEKCEALCKADVALNIERRKVKLTRLPSLKRLVLIYAAKKDYEQALALCEKAVELKLIDKKKEGYEQRRDKISAKLEKQRKREEREKKRAERMRKRMEKEALGSERTSSIDTEGVK